VACRQPVVRRAITETTRSGSKSMHYTLGMVTPICAATKTVSPRGAVDQHANCPGSGPYGPYGPYLSFLQIISPFGLRLWSVWTMWTDRPLPYTEADIRGSGADVIGATRILSAVPSMLQHACNAGRPNPTVGPLGFVPRSRVVSPIRSNNPGLLGAVRHRPPMSSASGLLVTGVFTIRGDAAANSR
jgi:hypothetical protein